MQETICLGCNTAQEGGGADACAQCGAKLELDGRYVVRRQLGAGASSSTYLAEDTLLFREVVLKVLHLERLEDWKALELFERHYTILSGLHHGGIPRVFDKLVVDLAGRQRHLIVQEHIDGRSLKDALAGGMRFTEATARRFLEAMLDILGYLHGFSPPILHRDIKPGNIILRERDDSPVLIDFDTARGQAVDHSIADGTMVGTAGYVPMEQLSGQPAPASDVYALGVTLVAMLTRRPISEIPIEGMRLRFEPMVNVSPGFTQTIKAMIAPDVADRAASVEAVRSLLDAPVEAAAAAAPPPFEVPTPPPFEVPSPPAFEAPPPARHSAPPAPRRTGGAMRGKGLLIVLALVMVPMMSYIAWSALTERLEANDEAPSVARALEGARVDTLASVPEGVVWARMVKEVTTEFGDDSWSAHQAEGPPDVFPAHSDAPKAWAPKPQDAGFEWIEVGFDETETRDIYVVETFNPGAIVRIDDTTDANRPVVLWSGASPASQESRVLHVRLPQPREIVTLRVVLDTRRVDGWNELDAIGLGTE